MKSFILIVVCLMLVSCGPVINSCYKLCTNGKCNIEVHANCKADDGCVNCSDTKDNGMTYEKTFTMCGLFSFRKIACATTVAPAAHDSFQKMPEPCRHIVTDCSRSPTCLLCAP